MDDRSFVLRRLLEANPYPVRTGISLTGMPSIFLRAFIWAHPLTINDLIGCVAAKVRISDRYCPFPSARDIFATISAPACACNYEYSDNDGTTGDANSFGH